MLPKYDCRLSLIQILWKYLKTDEVELNSAKPELRFCVDSNPVLGVSVIRDGKDLWQWSQLEIRWSVFRLWTMPQNQFTILIIIIKRRTSWLVIGGIVEPVTLKLVISLEAVISVGLALSEEKLTQTVFDVTGWDLWFTKRFLNFPDWILCYHEPFHGSVKKSKKNINWYISSKLQSLEMYLMWIC